MSSQTQLGTSTAPASAGAECEVHIDGLRVRFLRAGTGPALVLVHGLLGYSFSWRHVIPIFARNAEVFAPDLPGAGLSDCGPNLDCNVRSAARRLLGFLDDVGINSCDLIGSSYGGTTVVMLAGLAPSRVRRLILVSPANPWSRNGRRRLRLLKNPMIAWLFPILARPMRPLHAYFVRRMYGDPRKVTSDTLQGYARPLVLPGRFEHAVRIVQTWQSGMQEFEATLAQISAVPTLLVWGSKDRVVDPASAVPLASRLPHAEIATIQGAGHMPYEEYPEEFSQVVTDFLTRVVPSTAASGK